MGKSEWVLLQSIIKKLILNIIISNKCMQNKRQTHKRIISDVVLPECRWWSSIMCTRRWFSKELPVLLLRCERSLCGKSSERATSLWHYLSTCPSPEATAHVDMLTFVLLELHSRHAWSIGMCTSIKSLRPWPIFYKKNKNKNKMIGKMHKYDKRKRSIYLLNTINWLLEI